MEELIFFAVLILFSILDAIARKRRGRHAEEAPGPDEIDPAAARRRPTKVPGAETEPPSSEGMLPRDLWEEIAALTRGERPGASGPGEAGDSSPSEAEGERGERRRPRLPASSPIRREQVGAREVGTREVGTRGELGEHPIHGFHAEYGTDPSSRTPVPEPRRGGPGREVREVRRALLEGGASEARKAVILHEVLGKPLAYRDPGPEGPGS